MPAWLDDIVKRIAASPRATAGGIAGCSLDEIAALEDRYAVRLPQAYKDVLQAIGRRADGLFDREELDVHHDQLMTLTERAIDIAAHEGVAAFPANAFVIRGRYLEQFEFILCDGGDDAPVHYWNSDEDAPVEVFPSIRAWLEAICADELA